MGPKVDRLLELVWSLLGSASSPFSQVCLVQSIASPAGERCCTIQCLHGGCELELTRVDADRG